MCSTLHGRREQRRWVAWFSLREGSQAAPSYESYWSKGREQMGPAGRGEEGEKLRAESKNTGEHVLKEQHKLRSKFGLRTFIGYRGNPCHWTHQV